VHGAPLVPLDVSRYYGIDFAATDAYVEPEATQPVRAERPERARLRR
jgi:hypothetical protein